MELPLPTVQRRGRSTVSARTSRPQGGGQSPSSSAVAAGPTPRRCCTILNCTSTRAVRCLSTKLGRRAELTQKPFRSAPESRRSSYGEWVYDPQAVERVISPWLNPNRNRRGQQRLQVAAVCRARLLTGAARSARQHTHVNQRERGCRGGDGRSPLVRPV